MTPSQRKFEQGYNTLRQQGWPDEAIRAISAVFMEAGVMAYLEQKQAEQERNEALIQRVQVVQPRIVYIGGHVAR